MSKLIRLMRCRSGFSLIDVLMGMVLLTIALASTYQLTFDTSRLMQRNQYLAAATTLAEYKLEELRNTDYAAVVTGSDEGALNAMGEAGGPFTRAWTVQAETPAAGLKTVVVAVSWSQFDATQTFTLTGVVGQ